MRHSETVAKGDFLEPVFRLTLTFAFPIFNNAACHCPICHFECCQSTQDLLTFLLFCKYSQAAQKENLLGDKQMTDSRQNSNTKVSLNTSCLKTREAKAPLW